MPNHVRCVLKFTGLEPEDIRLLLNSIATPNGDTFIINFDKIIPEPREESECPEFAKRTATSYVQEDTDRPWFDWYKWHNKYWNTKWNAYDGYVRTGKSWIMFVFSTAWAMPEPVIEQLKLFGFYFILRYADEDWGSNCGIYSFAPEDDDYTTHIREDELKNPRAFARNLWNKY